MYLVGHTCRACHGSLCTRGGDIVCIVCGLPLEHDDPLYEQFRPKKPAAQPVAQKKPKKKSAPDDVLGLPQPE